MRRPLAVVALSLLLAPAAAAKGVIALEVCGPAGCEKADVPQGLHEFPGAGGATGPPPAGPYHELRLGFGGSHRETGWYVPGARRFAWPAVAGEVRWTAAGPQRIDRLVAAAAERVEPFRPRAVAALVGNRRVRGDVSGYLGLFALSSTGPARAVTSGSEQVSVKTEPPSPWALTGLWFYPDAGLLGRGPDLIRLSDDVAADLRAARSIDAGPGSTGFDWPLVTGSLLVAVALALAGLALVRHARRAAPRTA
jgi:hypothetical protein